MLILVLQVYYYYYCYYYYYYYYYYLLLPEHNASVNSSCTHPPSLGNCGAFAHLVSPGGGALANLAWLRGRAFDYAGYYPWAIGTWFPTLNPNMEDPAVCRRLARRRLACPSKLRTGQTCGGFLDFMHLFLNCLPRHNLSYQKRLT